MFKPWDGHQLHMVCLLDDSMTWAGVLGYNADEPGSGALCEVICLSLASARGSGVSSAYPEVSLNETFAENGVYEFYNVLLIDRQSNVAYRNGLGRVWKPAWERLRKDIVPVRLG